MSDELVKRLRGWDHCWPAPWLERAVTEAADRIEALQAERERLREALLCGRRLWAIAQDDRVRLLIQLEQCEKRHE